MEALVTLRVIPGRAEPKESAEMTTQFLFGERLEILDRQAEWSKVRSHQDEYIAWVNNLQIAVLSEKEVKLWDESPQHINFQSSLILQSSFGDYNLGYGACLPLADHISIGKIKYAPGTAHPPKPDFLPFLYSWQNTPYLWGGKTTVGVDCSGFTQIAMLWHGVQLPRDAWMQAKIGTQVPTVEKAQLGDLAFFEKKGRVTHVGIVLPENKIIHASGFVRIDTLLPEGIWNEDTQTITHQLCGIQSVV